MDENEESKEPTIQDKYAALFSKGLGLEVLADMLAMCHFGATLDPDNKAQIAEHNVGIAILAKCGVLQKDNLVNVIQNMLGLRPRRKST